MYIPKETRSIAVQISESESVQELRAIAIDMLKDREFWKGKCDKVYELEDELKELKKRINTLTGEQQQIVC